MKDNDAYRQLVSVTDDIVRKARATNHPTLFARPAAFREACRLHPELAAVARFPDDKQVVAQTMDAAPEQPKAPQTFEERMHAAESGSLVKACEQLAQG